MILERRTRDLRSPIDRKPNLTHITYTKVTLSRRIERMLTPPPGEMKFFSIAARSSWATDMGYGQYPLQDDTT